MIKYGIIGTKVVVIVLLFILSIINANVSFIKSHPRKFIIETTIMGLSAGLPFAFIAMNRGKDPVSFGVIAFMVFVLFHIFMEFSGENQAMIDENKKALIERKSTQLVAFVAGLSVLALALVTRDIGPGFPVLSREALFMALCGALPTILIAKNRNEKSNSKEFVTYFVLFFIGHYILQLSGFYTQITE